MSISRTTWLHETLPWVEPLHMAAGVPESAETWCFLYSSLRTDSGGRYSYLCLNPREQLADRGWEHFGAVLRTDGAWYEDAWFGTLGYGLKDALEHLPEDTRDGAASFASMLPNLQMVRYGVILRWDHDQQLLELFAEDAAARAHLPEPSAIVAHAKPCYKTGLRSPMSTPDYLAHVETILERIRAGDVYQANLTRKFCGEVTEHKAAGALALFAKLCEVSPAPYSAFLRFEGTYIVSSSPEQFLTIAADGQVVSRPIKGTIGRSSDAGEDTRRQMQLANSAKDKAENLMIVDLMRNDLSRHCVPGSVEVKDLFAITSYATVHHMASRVQGQMVPDASTLQLVQDCFPPGSMTGAPKIRAMALCTQLERLARGIYSGAIGWFGGDGSCDLSVVIRTLLLQGNRFEFQVGGGIVADSDPQKEWEETLTKARGIATALGLDAAHLRTL